MTGGAGTYRSIVTSRDITGGGNRVGYTIYAAGNNTWQFWLGRGTSWYTLTGPAVQLNTWTLIDASFDGSNAKLYINGTLAASGTLSGYQPNTAKPLRIAAGATEGQPQLLHPRPDRRNRHLHQPRSAPPGSRPTTPPRCRTRRRRTRSIDSGPSGTVGSARCDASASTRARPARASSARSMTAAFSGLQLAARATAGLASGRHSFQVRATDAAGNTDPTPASQAWTVSLSAYPAAIIADNPAGYWRLGEASGSSALDSSANLLDGSYIGCPRLAQPGALSGDSDTAVGFNGSSQYAQVPYSAALNPAAFTVEAWAKVTGGAGTYRSIVTSRDITGGGHRVGYTIYAAGNNTWQFWLGRGSSLVHAHRPRRPAQHWTLIDASFDGTNAKLYINGTLAASGTLSGYQPNTAKPLRIAAGATEGQPQLLHPRPDRRNRHLPSPAHRHPNPEPLQRRCSSASGLVVPQWRYGYSNDQYAATAAADGNNVMDVGSKSAADATPAGTVGLVWIGDYDNTKCSWEVSDSQVQQIVRSGIGDPKVLGYFVSDEPDPYACPNAVSDHKARNAMIKSIDPGKITFIVVDSNSGLQTLSQIPLWKGAADYIGYDPYPCHTGAACDYSWIDQVLAAADASGNPYWLIVQAFASASWRWPTPEEESHMLQQGAKSHMAGIGVFSWFWNNDALVNHPDVLQVIANYMLGKDFVPPGSPSALSTSAPGQSSLTLSWTAATDDTAVGSYRLYRNGTRVDTTSALRYQFTGLSCGTTYSLGVAAVDTSGNLGPTATLSAATSPCPVIVAAGDICGSATDCAPTANLIGSIAPTAVLPLGDNAYSSGSATEYANYYAPNWGKYRAITYPTPGNHDYNTPGAAGTSPTSTIRRRTTPTTSAPGT